MDGGAYCLYSGDGIGDGTVNSLDISNTWNSSTGKQGYLNGDFDLDGESANKDKK